MARPKDDTPKPPVDTTWRDAPIPDSQEAMQKVISKGVARNLELACTSKDLSEAIKVAADWYETLYGADEDDGLWSGLTGQGASNGHRG